MGLAKYTEDDNEIISERMDKVTNPKSPYIGIITTFPLMACTMGTSIENNSNGQKVGPIFKYDADITLRCRSCGKKFVFSMGEQWFYKMNSLHHPKRCKACLENKKIKRLTAKNGR